MARLDKNHGFMRFIVQNQIKRSEYEQEQKALRFLDRHAEVMQYTARKLNQVDVLDDKEFSECCPHPDAEGVTRCDSRRNILLPNDMTDEKHMITGRKLSSVLFELQYVPAFGEGVNVMVHKDSCIKEILRKICEKCEMDEDLKEVLQRRIWLEMEKCS